MVNVETSGSLLGPSWCNVGNLFGLSRGPLGGSLELSWGALEGLLGQSWRASMKGGVGVRGFRLREYISSRARVGCFWSGKLRRDYLLFLPDSED